MYLGVDDDEAIELGHIAIKIIPQEMLLKFITWGFEYFWDRRAGWPDLFVFKDKIFFFVEVRGPTDKISLNQMKWFRWAVKEANICCEIIRVQEDKQ